MASTSPTLEALQAAHPTIPLVLPSSPEYPSVRHIYNALSSAIPFAIAQPQTAQDVAALIRFASAHSIEISVRVGGHDVHGRSIIPGALVLDLRGLNRITVNSGDADGKQGTTATATLGGGVLQGALATTLGEHGLVAATGTIDSVGYVGWATLGGYGPWTSVFGLGVDQIVAATIVNAQGEIVQADEETLAGIRGASGNFGVIVEVVIKVYPFDKVCLTISFCSGFLNWGGLLSCCWHLRISFQSFLPSPHSRSLSRRFFTTNWNFGYLKFSSEPWIVVSVGKYLPRRRGLSLHKITSVPCSLTFPKSFQVSN